MCLSLLSNLIGYKQSPYYVIELFNDSLFYLCTGEWVNGVKEGSGKETLKDSTFEGEFADNLVSCYSLN